MNRIATFIIAMSLTIMASAQYGLNVSYQFGISGTDLYSSTMNNSMLGINAKLTYQMDDYVKFNIGTGYYNLPFKTQAYDGVLMPVSNVKATIIPLTFGVDFSFVDAKKDAKQKFVPFVGLDLGWAWAMRSSSAYAPSATTNNFLLVPLAGVNYKLTDNLDLSASVRQNLFIYTFRGVSQYYEIFSLVGINVGLNYKF